MGIPSICWFPRKPQISLPFLTPGVDVRGGVFQDIGCLLIRALRRSQERAGFPATSPSPTNTLPSSQILPSGWAAPLSPSTLLSLSCLGPNHSGPLGCGKLAESQLDLARPQALHPQVPPPLSGLNPQLC